MMMVKNAFFIGMGLGLVAGTYLIKHCPAVREAFDSAESTIKCKVDEVKTAVKNKKQQAEMAVDNQMYAGEQMNAGEQMSMQGSMQNSPVSSQMNNPMSGQMNSDF